MSDIKAQVRIARILAGALGAGVLGLWVVAAVMVHQRGGGLSPELGVSSELAFWIWAAAAGTGLVAALFFRSRATGSGRDPDQVQSNLIIAWALLEGPALLGGVLYILLGEIQLLTALPVYGLGFVATFPRVDWFQPPATAREWT